MTPDEIKALASPGESKTIKFKATSGARSGPDRVLLPNPTDHRYRIWFLRGDFG